MCSRRWHPSRWSLTPVVSAPTLRYLDPAREEPLSQDFDDAQESGADPKPHRRRGVSLPLGEVFQVVPPHDQHPEPIHRALPALSEGDRLPLVVGAAMADQE